MLQLIYTSAPKLLESGKSGFGTVAQSRQLPLPLKAQLERISSYDRDAAVESYLLYSTFPYGATRYHLFSRIGNSGTDYTLRTNHIAHHWVVSESEACSAGWLESTPAALMEALRGMWLQKWDAPPQWIEVETPLPAPVTISGGCWRRYTGSGDNARWLAMPEYAEGAYIVCPQIAHESELLALLHESMLNRPDKGWGKGFMTALASTVSRKQCPFICLGAAQCAAGISPRSQLSVLQVTESMEAPVLPVPVASSVVRVPEPSSERPFELPSVPPPVCIPDSQGTASSPTGQGRYLLVAAVVVLALGLLGFCGPDKAGTSGSNGAPGAPADSPPKVVAKRPAPKAQQPDKPARKLADAEKKPAPGPAENVPVVDPGPAIQPGPKQFIIRLSELEEIKIEVKWNEKKERLLEIHIPAMSLLLPELKKAMGCEDSKNFYYSDKELKPDARIEIKPEMRTAAIPAEVLNELQRCLQTEQAARDARKKWEERPDKSADKPLYSEEDEYRKAIEAARKEGSEERARVLEKQLAGLREKGWFACNIKEQESRKLRTGVDKAIREQAEKLQTSYQKYTVILFNHQTQGSVVTLESYEIKYCPPSQEKK